jgi:stearoyl-CoA desaturase (Delta-9 desaturase)
VVFIGLFFVMHYCLSIFFQSFFMHRYGAHKMFSMSRGWERFFYLAAYASMGSSFLVPRAYAMLHREHHAYSDTPKDPHTPWSFSNVLTLMWETKKRYQAYASRRQSSEPRFMGGWPEWHLVDYIGDSRLGRLCWMALYVAFYVHFATAWWQFALLPIHFAMGPIHGAIVNWCGHKYGYRNFENSDKSRNTIFFDLVTWGELFQNNHHKFGMSPNFAARWFEIDPTYQVMRIFALLRIIDFGENPQVARYEPAS